MAPPRIGSGRRDVQKHRVASRVSKNRTPNASAHSQSKLKPSLVGSSGSTTINSGAFDDEAEHQISQHERRTRLPKSATPHSALTMGGPSNLSLKTNSKDEVDDKAESEIPGELTSSPLPGSSSTHTLNMDSMPAEILEMIWREAILLPACHTFKVRKSDPAETEYGWSVHLWPKEDKDTSAYLSWKRLLSLNNIGVQTSFRRFVKQLQPLTLRVPWTRKSLQKPAMFFKAMAAIDAAQDLVILDLCIPSLPWSEHIGSGRRGMKPKVIRDRMSHFSRVAIPYKFDQRDCGLGGDFACICHGVNQSHDGFNACPLAVACFLDLFPNLEHFYFVVDTKLVWHKKFAAQYREEVAKNDFKVQITHPGGPKAFGKQYTLARFFDTKYEYLQQAPAAYLDAMGRADITRADISKERRDRPPSPWVGDGSAQQCLIETGQFYKSLKGNEEFRQELEKRVKVRFGVLIPYLLKGKDKKVAK